MKLRERDEPLDPSAERELEAVELALAGRSVDPDLEGWAELSALLAEERPQADQRWSAELDEHAARRFRPDDGGSGEGSLRAFADRLRELSPRRMAAPAGALTTLAIVAAVAVSTLGGDQSGGDAASGGSALQTTTSNAAAQSSAASGESTPAPPDEAAGLPDAEAAARSAARDSGYPAGTRRLAPGTKRRQEDRDVALTLSAPPDGVADVSDEAISITRDLDGIVTSSQVSTAGMRASATLALTIPSRNLDSALDRLTKIADVKSLQQSSVDITPPFVNAKDRLADAEAERRSLLEALGNASTDEEAAALKLQIKDARRQISRARSSFENVARRARLSQISLAIDGDPKAAGSGDEGRTLGTWLDDTLSVLRDVAGVLLITAAIVLPLGLLIALAWLGIATLRRAHRERALSA